MDIWDIPYGYAVFHTMVMYCVGNTWGTGENHGIYPVVQWYIYIYTCRANQLDMMNIIVLEHVVYVQMTD